ncbi:MAG: lysoplasmalogenase [Anaerolineales bacterium]|nr:lysoplasmalogenase [Anaerolineales bacterium]
MTSVAGLSILILFLATGAIWSDVADRKQLHYLLKPLSTILIIGLALVTAPAPRPFYATAIVVGLVFSLGGDIFLMLPQDRFLAGLISFLLAHLAYIAAFVSVAGFHLAPVFLASLLIYGIVLFQLLWPGMGKMRGPAFVYMLAILTMAWQAGGLWQSTGASGHMLAAVGALFFVLSDSLLAYNRFRHPIPGGRVLVLGTYYLAQWLIALSSNY